MATNQATYSHIMNAKRGTIHFVIFQTILNDGSKNGGIKVYKVTSGLYRVGVNYSAIHNDLVNHEPKNHLPGHDSWLVYPYAIVSEKGIKIRLTNTFNGRAHHSTKIYIEEDGIRREATREEVIDLGLVPPSKLKPRTSPLIVFTVFLDNIIEFR